MQSKLSEFMAGLKDGIPTALGYVSVSVGFGILAVNCGLSVLESVLTSATNITSAGQVAGVKIIAAGGAIIEMILTTLIINLRYALMSVSLTQKLSGDYHSLHRLVTGFAMTDEVFAVASARKSEVTPWYMYGLAVLPILGWVSGTWIGAVAGETMPVFLSAAMGISIYGMFVAIILPPATENRQILFTVLLSVLLSCIFYYVPVLNRIPGGFSIIICSVFSSAIFAFLDVRKQVNE